MVPLTFVDEADYDKIEACDEVSTVGLHDVLTHGGLGDIVLKVTKKNSGETFQIPVSHTLSKGQCGFILAGSALNLLAKKHR